MKNKAEKKMPKIGIVQIGTSLVGPLSMDKLVRTGFGNVVLISSNIENFAEKHASDIQSAYGKDVSVAGGTHYALLTGAEIVVITGAIPMQPGMTREDLTKRNAIAFSDVSIRIREVAPEAEIVLAPFGVTYPATLREIVGMVNSRVKHLPSIMPPEKEDAYEEEGPFTLSERILDAVKDLVESMS